jgi:hypothetical protein
MEFIVGESVIEEVSFNRFVLCCVVFPIIACSYCSIQRTDLVCHFHTSISVFIVGIVNVKIKLTKTLSSLYVFVNIHMQK